MRRFPGRTLRLRCLIFEGIRKPVFMRFTILAILLFSFTAASGQKKVLEHADFDIWNGIENKHLSPDGAFVLYHLEKGEKDQSLKIKHTDGRAVFPMTEPGKDGSTGAPDTPFLPSVPGRTVCSR